MEADPSVYHLPASGRQEITVFPGTLATTGDKMPTQHLVWEIASASSSFENPLFGRGPCAQEMVFAASGAGFYRQVLHVGQGWVPGWRARTYPVLTLPWAVRLQDGLLSARKHPLGCYDFFFLPTLYRIFLRPGAQGLCQLLGFMALGLLAQPLPLTGSAPSWR